MIKCDYGDACPGHASHDDKPCTWHRPARGISHDEHDVWNAAREYVHDQQKHRGEILSPQPAPRYSVERLFEIWDDKNREHVEVGPDRDGLDLIEIRQYTDDNKIACRMSFPKELAKIISVVLAKAAEE